MKVLPPLLVAVCSVLVYYPMFRVQVTKHDYQMHLRAAFELLNDGVLKSSHFLYQLLIIFFRKITCFDWTLSALLGVLVSVITVNLLIYWRGWT